jgi:hypothetical protein
MTSAQGGNGSHVEPVSIPLENHGELPCHWISSRDDSKVRRGKMLVVASRCFIARSPIMFDASSPPTLIDAPGIHVGSVSIA